MVWAVDEGLVAATAGEGHVFLGVAVQHCLARPGQEFHNLRWPPVGTVLLWWVCLGARPLAFLLDSLLVVPGDGLPLGVEGGVWTLEVSRGVGRYWRLEQVVVPCLEERLWGPLGRETVADSEGSIWTLLWLAKPHLEHCGHTLAAPGCVLAPDCVALPELVIWIRDPHLDPCSQRSVCGLALVSGFQGAVCIPDCVGPGPGVLVRNVVDANQDPALDQHYISERLAAWCLAAGVKPTHLGNVGYHCPSVFVATLAKELAVLAWPVADLVLEGIDHRLDDAPVLVGLALTHPSLDGPGLTVLSDLPLG